MDHESKMIQSNETEGRQLDDVAIILQLLDQLPPINTPEFTEIQLGLATVATSDTDSEEYNQRRDQYRRIVEDIAGPLTNETIESRSKVYLTLLLHEVLILRTIGDKSGYVTGLKVAAYQARSIDLFSIASDIEDLITTLTDSET